MFWTLGDSRLTLHHPDKIHMYSVTREQLLLLYEKAQSERNSYYPTAFSIMVTCLINCIVSLNDTKSNIFIGNSIIGVAALIIGVIFFCVAKWKQRSNKLLLTEILSQPIQTASNDNETDIKDWAGN